MKNTLAYYQIFLQNIKNSCVYDGPLNYYQICELITESIDGNAVEKNSCMNDRPILAENVIINFFQNIGNVGRLPLYLQI
jgi:hypothetical protein